jgi:hypothetical protein
MNSRPYEIGAYYFPGYHEDKLVSAWHGQGWTEWRLLAAAKPRFRGHRQPKVPLAGPTDEASPAVMKQKAKLAYDHGLNHFIFDWYYYKDGPFLNRCLDEGYLGIKPAPKLKFALMWANHDWFNIQPARLAGKDPLMLAGALDRKQFDEICDHLIERYFKSPLYWLVDGLPYFSIYDLPNLIKGLGGVVPAAKALAAFRQKAVRAGLGGLHLNLVHWQTKIVGSDDLVANPEKAIAQLGFDSLSSYVWIHHFPPQLHQFPKTPYREVLQANVEYWQKTSAGYPIPYFPNVTMGWDASPRCAQTDDFENRAYPFMATMSENTPANFRAALALAKNYVDSHPLPARHISINAWNEWTEGSYLEPDVEHKNAYLKAIRSVFGSR